MKSSPGLHGLRTTGVLDHVDLRKFLRDNNFEDAQLAEVLWVRNSS